MNRPKMLSQLEGTTEWDIVIIGGGATGLGAAVDAGSRGYKALLIEQFDFGKGTSSKSTKLAHGGVRYLAQGNIKLVREALRERSYLLSNAPKVTNTLAFVVPVYSRFDLFFYAAGLKIYDLLSGKLSLGKTKVLSRTETLSRLPTAKADGLAGGILYFDGQFDDSRLAIDLAVTAARYDVTMLNYCKADSLVKSGARITGLRITDEINHHKYEVKAKTIINATGVFTDAVLKMDDAAAPDIVTASQGIHLVINKSFFPGSHALMIPKTDDGRVLFAVPWHDKVILGTTDTGVKTISVDPQALPEEIEFILRNANRYLNVSITRKDVDSIFAGLRPLVKKSGTSNTAVLSRDHTILVSASGLITITGGKWTTYRKMAADVIDQAIVNGNLPPRACITKDLKIDSLPDGLADERVQSSFAINQRQIEYFVQQEMCVTLEDLLARRTRLLFLDARRAMALAPSVAAGMAKALEKNGEWIEEQVTSFNQLAKQYCLAE